MEKNTTKKYYIRREMKKLLLLLIPFACLFAEEQTINKSSLNKDGYLYLSTMTSNNNTIQNLLYPYYMGVGYRYKFGMNAVDFNINVPVLIVAYQGHNLINSDISYLRYTDKNFYFIGGLTQEGGKTSRIKYYFISPFVGFGREFDMYKSKIFLHFKLNSLMYFPYLTPRYGYYIRDDIDKNTFWKNAQFNFCAGFNF